MGTGDRFLQKIEDFIRLHQMIEPGDQVIAGVSGGADSICLLLALLRLRETFGHQVSVVHIEHGIRGEASAEDAEFVRSFCSVRGIECHIIHYKVPEYAREHKMSEEEAGRKLRYQAFREEKERYPHTRVRIAVAHHLGDSAETMLFHLARGSGIRGLGGIAPVYQDVIRPLLAVRREEIEYYLAGLGQAFCQDATNELDQYSRNRIRHQALPALVQVNSRAQEHMYAAAQQLREIRVYLQKQAEAASQTCCVQLADGIRIEQEAFLRLDPVLQKELLYQLLETMAGSGRDLTREHIAQVRELFDKQNGRRTQLPYEMQAVRVYGGVELCVVKNVENAESNVENQEEKQFCMRIMEGFSEHMSQISKKKYTKWFDYDKIKNGFCIRNRQPGDYLVVDDSGRRQKLKKYLVNEKIPAKERERLPLLADGAHIMWVVGHRISSYYKVDKQTRKILEVTFCGGKEHE